MTPEGEIKREVRKVLNALEPPCWQYWPVPMGMGVATVDVLICWRGIFYAVEVKRETGGRLTKRQEDTLNDIATAGGGVCVESSPGCETLKQMLGLI